MSKIQNDLQNLYYIYSIYNVIIVYVSIRINFKINFLADGFKYE